LTSHLTEFSRWLSRWRAQGNRQGHSNTERKGKPKAIREVIDAFRCSFGNSIWDADMLEIARHPFAINPTEELESIARQRQWPIYFPESVRS
jgi:phosphoserine phosphatase